MRVANRIAWAIVIAWVAGVVATAVRIERWLGGGHPGRLTFDVTVPEYDARSDERVLAALDQRLRGRSPAIERGVDRFHLLVTVDGGPRDVEPVRDLLTRSGSLEFFEAVPDTPLARAWYARGRARSLPAGVEAEADAWTNERDGGAYTDYYLRAPTTDALDAAIAQGEPLPAGLRVLYERVIPLDDAKRSEPFFRTHVVVAEPELDGRDIEKANLVFDQNTLRPEVIIHFGRDGARRFGELTGRIVGHKLAIVLDGEVRSAPIVQTAIRGGITTITMGGNDQQAMEQEANDLVNVLRAGAALPSGMTASLLASTPAEAGSTWLPRLAIALLAGVLAFFVAPRLAHLAPAGRAPPIARGGGGLASTAIATALTLGLPLALIVLGPRVPLPFLDRAGLRGVGFGSLLAAPPEAHVFALGLTAVLSGFWLAELVAALVPGWRRRRLGSVSDRRAIDRLARGLVLAIAALQAWFVVVYLAGRGGPGTSLVLGNQTVIVPILVLTLVAGVAVQMLIADVITRHGLCNGYVALIAVGVARSLAKAFTRPSYPGLVDDRAELAAIVAVIALAGLVATALRDAGPDRRRLPWTGVVPLLALAIAGGLLMLALQVLSLPDGVVRIDLIDVLLRPPAWLAITAPLVLAIVLVSARGLGALTAGRTGLALTLGFTIVLVLLRQVVSSPALFDGWLLPVVMILGLLVDGGRALLARLGLPAPVAILAVHDVERADRAADALAAAGIPASVENLRLRALLRGLGGFAPIVLRVAGADATRAIEAIAAAEATRDPLVAPFAA